MNPWVLIIGAVVLFAIMEQEEWTGYVYPDKGNLSHSIKIGSFDSLESCGSSARRTLTALDKRATGDYECGLNCKVKHGMNVCKRTSR